MRDPRPCAALAFAALLAFCAVAWPQDPVPECGPAAVAGRVDLDQGDPAPTDCACYDATAETCMLSTLRCLRDDLALARTEAAARLESCQDETQALIESAAKAERETEQVRAELEQSAPAWWDRFEVGAGSAAVVAVLLILITR